MKTYIEWHHGLESDIYNQLIEKAVQETLISLKVELDIEVCVNIIDNEEMQTINKEQRGKDSPTDVLSFPMYEFDYTAPESFALLLENEMPNPETDAYYIGDMLIAWDKVVEQSQAYNHSLERELAFLVVHSMLHMFGYDHIEKNDEVVMLDLQKKIMNQLGLSR